MASFAPVRGTRTQIQSTPIVDGQFLIETDQGVGNKIYMDVGSTRTEVGGNSISGVLPELYIYSETGSVVTVEDENGNTIPTSQIGTDHWICEVPDYGTYTVYSVLSGDTTTKSINVTDCMIYTIDDSHFHSNIVVTYPSGVGATCQCSGGGETFSAPALNPPDTSYKFVVHGQNTTYTITTNVDGVSKTKTITTGTTLDETFQVSMPYAQIELEVEIPPMTGNVTCSDGTTTITKPATANMNFYIPNTGTWTISGTDGTETYTTVIEVTDLSQSYSAILRSVPNGSTVLPINDVHTWLECAGLKDSTYTTLEEIYNDRETLAILITDENACNYLVRSTLWASNNGLVPKMTGNTTPEGNCFTSYTASSGTQPYMAFDQNTSTNSGPSDIPTEDYIGYDFVSPQIVQKATIDMYVGGGSHEITLHLEGSNDNFVTPVELGTVTFTCTSTRETHTILAPTNTTAYASYRIRRTMTNPSALANRFWYYEIQFYPFAETPITENNIAMRYIGRRNYCSNVLLNNDEWCTAIVYSPYVKQVLNEQIPSMTKNEESFATASASYSNSSYPPWQAFRGSDFYLNPVPTSSRSNGWWADTHQQGTILYLDLTTAMTAKVACLAKSATNYPNTTYQFSVWGSNDKSDPSSWVKIVNNLSAPPTNYTIANQLSVARANNDSNVAYKYYKWECDAASNTNDAGVLLQLLGRQDVDETLIDVYSAADDTLTVMSVGGTSTVITTDNSGYAQMLFPAYGTYTFLSANAKTPDTGANYSKEIPINQYTMEIRVMPDGALYWFGYNAMEKANTTNGWISSDGDASVLLNLRDVEFQYGTGTSTGMMGYPIKLSNVTKLNVMATATAANNGMYVVANNAQKCIDYYQSPTGIVYQRFDNLDSTYQKYTYTLPNTHKDNVYIGFGKTMSGYSVTSKGHAFWYE